MFNSRPIRRAQLISSFGIGAMVDFPKDESLMTAGLDAWPLATDSINGSPWYIQEERLQARLGVEHFRQPPAYDDTAADLRFARQSVPFVRFPCWHYCHHCGAMEYVPLFGGRQRCVGPKFDQQSCADWPEKKRPFLIPMRFVAVCEQGHVQDFPFMEWVHHPASANPDCKLRARAGRSSAGLAGMFIECTSPTCGAERRGVSKRKERSLSTIFEYNPTSQTGALDRVGCRCLHGRPWLGEYQPGPTTQSMQRTICDSQGNRRDEQITESCGRPLRVVQRGASNVYFPHVVSSIYLPLWAENTRRPVVEALEDAKIWQALSSGLESGRISLTKCQVVADLRNLNASELLTAAQAKYEGRPLIEEIHNQSEDEYRRGEYDALCQGRGGEQTELQVELANLGNYDSWVGRWFSRICLVHKLRETRALAGFTRLLPPDGSQGDPRLQPLRANSLIKWLPAIIVRGEGLFFELNSDEISHWLDSSPAASNRILKLDRIYNEGRRRRSLPERRIGPKYVLLHTLAHLFINQLSFDCGYGSASLRERIYCEFEVGAKPMQGILIYTASGDAEGTMGGLVRQGQPSRLEATMLGGLRAAAWCSSDPVCIESQGQGADNANLAACHGCALVPETSCESGNRLLDRAMLVGTPEQPRMGCFSDLL